MFLFILDIDECELQTDNCHDDALCTNSDGSYTCTCNSGFIGDGMDCIGTHIGV